MAPRVLVVDDSEAQRYAVSHALRSEGYEVVEASTGHGALDLAQRFTPDAVVLDVDLPDLDGFEVCRRLKSATSEMLPVLHLSAAMAASDARARGLDAGADGYLLQPFDPNELRSAVRALVRLKRQEAIRVAEASVSALLVDALDALADHVALLGHDSRVIAVNRAWARFAGENGYAEGGTGLGTNYCDVCANAAGKGSDEAHAAEVGIWQVLSGSVGHFEIDYPCHSPSEERWFRMTVRPVSHPGPVAGIVTHVDRTREVLAARAEAVALEAASAALAEAEADRRRLSATLAALPVGVWLADTEGRITHSNPAAARLWGGRAPHASSAREYDVYRGWRMEDGRLLEGSDWPLARTLATGASVTDELIEIGRFDGKRGFAINSSVPILDQDGSIVGGLAVSVDVTDRQAAVLERERMISSVDRERARLASVFEHATSFMAVMRGADHLIERANPSCMRLIGEREILGRPVAVALPELVQQGFATRLADVWRSGVPFVGKQLKVQFARDGVTLDTSHVDLVIQRLEEGEGEHSLVVHGVDVTDQVRAVEKVKRTKQQLRDQFAKLPVPTFLWVLSDDQLILENANELAASLPVGMFTMPGDDERVFCGPQELALACRRCLREDVVLKRMTEFEHPDSGARSRYEITMGPQQPSRVLLHVVDVTERAELEGQLRQAQKMDAVGRLAGGVAHDFNNLLTVIGAHSEFLLESMIHGDPQRSDAEEIQKASRRAAGLTKQLLAFSRKQMLKPTLLDLNDTVSHMRTMLERLLGEDIAIVTHLVPDLGRVVADATKMDQVLMNLAVNARDAMPSGGTLTVATTNVAIASSVRGPTSVLPVGAYAVLEVSDTGMGMHEAVQSRLFEPFFTTKEPGKGTGLGLATVYGIVKQSAGYILVESAPERGSVFRVYMPVVSSEEGEEELRAAESAAVHGMETVLLVEDEPAVRAIARHVLRRHGYAVLEAGNGADALALSAAYPHVIDLVVSDAVMPGMNGAETVRALSAARPEMRVLFVSGYTDDNVIRRGVVSASVPFLQKPFTPSDLAQAVRAALDA